MRPRCGDPIYKVCTAVGKLDPYHAPDVGIVSFSTVLVRVSVGDSVSYALYQYHCSLISSFSPYTLPKEVTRCTRTTFFLEGDIVAIRLNTYASHTYSSVIGPGGL